MSFLSPPSAPAAPPPPPIAQSAPVALSQNSAQQAAAAAAGKGFNKTIKTTPKGAPTPSTTSQRLIPAQAGTATAFGT